MPFDDLLDRQRGPTITSPVNERPKDTTVCECKAPTPQGVRWGSVRRATSFSGYSATNPRRTLPLSEIDIVRLQIEVRAHWAYASSFMHTEQIRIPRSLYPDGGSTYTLAGSQVRRRGDCTQYLKSPDELRVYVATSASWGLLLYNFVEWHRVLLS